VVLATSKEALDTVHSMPSVLLAIVANQDAEGKMAVNGKQFA
jgi:hypothetical protein